MPLAQRRSWLVGVLALAGVMWLGAIAPARAALVVTPTTLTLELAPGGIGIVRGDITNTTGFDLLSTDFFGSFSGFESDALIVDQLLGLTEVPINDRAVTRDLDLFSVQLGAGAQAGLSYSIEFFFGDINGSFSPTTTFVVDVAGSQAAPEPGVAWLVGGGLLGLAAMGRRARSQSTQEG